MAAGSVPPEFGSGCPENCGWPSQRSMGSAMRRAWPAATHRRRIERTPRRVRRGAVSRSPLRRAIAATFGRRRRRSRSRLRPGVGFLALLGIGSGYERFGLVRNLDRDTVGDTDVLGSGVRGSGSPLIGECRPWLQGDRRHVRPLGCTGAFDAAHQARDNSCREDDLPRPHKGPGLRSSPRPRLRTVMVVVAVSQAPPASHASYISSSVPRKLAWGQYQRAPSAAT